MLARPLDLVMWTSMGSAMPGWFLLLYLFVPVLQHLRLLRTLPLSTTGLAAVLLGLVLLPLLALGVLATVVAWLTLGPPAALAWLNSYTLVLAPAALGAAFLTWRGVGALAHAVLLVSLVGFVVAQQWLQGRFHFLERSLSLAGPIAAVGVLLGLAFICLALSRSRHAYRVQGNLFGTIP
jgi:hypothetical protein